MKSWPTAELTCLPDAVEIVSSALWDAGASGIETVSEETDETILRAYFEPETNLDDLEATVRATLAQFEASPNSLISVERFATEDEDWLEGWKQGYDCFTIGSRWVVVPSWKRGEAATNPEFAGRLWIEIDPGMAFGTGTHETTRMCLEFLEGLPSAPGRVLDVGTGTGILAIGAAKLFSGAEIFACDNDPEALVVARENFELNGVADRVVVREGSVTEFPVRDFDVTLANLTADVIIPLADNLVDSVRPNGWLILSGILDTQIDDVREAVEPLAGATGEIRAAGEWRALAVRRVAE